MHRFSAPFDPRLRALTLAAAGLVSLAALYLAAQRQWWTAAALASALLVLATFSVRGYAVDGRTLRVARAGWTTVIDLSELSSAAPEPRLLDGSVSLFTTRGVFGVVGYAWRRRQGAYRVYVTDPRRAVVLRFRRGTPVVVSPGDTARFLAAVRAPHPVPGPVPPLPGLHARPPPAAGTVDANSWSRPGSPTTNHGHTSRNRRSRILGGGLHVDPRNSRESGPPGLHSRSLRRAAPAHLRHRVRR